jgi:uncharacterized protein (DUF169 family)
MSYRDLSKKMIDELGLDIPPIALKRVDTAPAGIPPLAEKVPSSCSMWRAAETKVFYADAAAHMNCPIGAMVMGFTLPESVSSELMATVGEMCNVCYISQDEVPHIPKFEKPASGILYGPLSSFPMAPDVVVLWAKPRQAMFLQEMAGNAAWSDNPQSFNLGRPGCAALPFSSKKGRAVLSNGCLGMRMFTQLEDDRSLFAIPGSKIDEFGGLLARTMEANRKMESLYKAKMEAMA